MAKQKTGSDSKVHSGKGVHGGAGGGHGSTGAEWNRRFRESGALWGGTPSPGARYAVGYFREKGVRQVLDVACGYGRDTIHLARELKFEVTGIDFSSEGIRMAAESAMSEGLRRASSWGT